MVELLNPLVNIGQLYQPVVVLRWGRPIIREPSKFRGVQKGGHGKFIPSGVGVVPVLSINIRLEPTNHVFELLSSSSLNKVVQTSYKENPLKSSKYKGKLASGLYWLSFLT